jgi:uncharacterized protein YkwD
MKQIFSVTLALLSFIIVEARPVPKPKSIDLQDTNLFVSPDSKMANDILGYVNAYRQKKGLPALTMNAVVSAQAQKHSENMAAHRTAFGHNGFQTRMKNISSQLGGANATAENVAFGNMDAKQVVDTWLTSPGHKQNIEGPYNLTGIGIASDNKGNLYFTQIFIAH